MNLFPQLKQLGLNNSEITIYLFLLENGLSGPPIISRGTKIARTNCYNILLQLESKGLIEEQFVGKRKVYAASDPQALLRNLDKRREAVQAIIPDLHGLCTTQKNKPKVRFYEGLEQIKDIYELSLQSKKIMVIGSTKQISILLPGYLDYYFGEVKKRGIIFYDILGKESSEEIQKAKKTLLGLYDARTLPSEYKDPLTDILLWDKNIALITLNEPSFGTILTNTTLSQTFQMLFEIIWKSAT